MLMANLRELLINLVMKTGRKGITEETVRTGLLMDLLRIGKSFYNNFIKNFFGNII